MANKPATKRLKTENVPSFCIILPITQEQYDKIITNLNRRNKKITPKITKRLGSFLTSGLPIGGWSLPSRVWSWYTVLGRLVKKCVAMPLQLV